MIVVIGKYRTDIFLLNLEQTAPQVHRCMYMYMYMYLRIYLTRVSCNNLTIMKSVKSI